MQGRRIVDAVAEVADGMAGCCSARTMRSFCCGSISTKSVVRGARCHSASSLIAASCAPVSSAGVQAHARATCAATWRLSPVTILMRMPRAASCCSVSRACPSAGRGTAGILQAHLGSRRRCVVGRAATVRAWPAPAGADPRCPARERGLQPRALGRRRAAHRAALAPSRAAARTLAKAPLVIIWCVVSPRRDDDGQPLAHEVVGNLVDLATPSMIRPACWPAATIAASSGLSMPVSSAALR